MNPLLSLFPHKPLVVAGQHQSLTGKVRDSSGGERMGDWPTVAWTNSGTCLPVKPDDGAE